MLLSSSFACFFMIGSMIFLIFPSLKKFEEIFLKPKIGILSISPIFIFSPFPFPTFIEIAPLPRVFQGIFGFNLTSLG